MKYYTETLQVPLKNCIVPQYCSTFTNSYGYLWVLGGSASAPSSPYTFQSPSLGFRPPLRTARPRFAPSSWSCPTASCATFLRRGATNFGGLFWEDKNLLNYLETLHILPVLPVFAAICKKRSPVGVHYDPPQPESRIRKHKWPWERFFLGILRTWFWGIATCSPFVAIM
jgi:hypothetical protein